VRIVSFAIVCSLVGLLCGAAAPPVAEQPSIERSSDSAEFVEFDCPDGQNVGSMSDGSVQYKEEKTAPGRCKWVVDEEAMKRAAELELHRRELWWALRSRPLTDDEMAEVKQIGIYLTVGDGESFKEEEKMRELNDALLQQYRLRNMFRP
jgi:hypothetical protein